ncbi:MAG: hypothetical protein WCJ18_05515, partial [Planctomycetota bacterium]
ADNGVIKILKENQTFIKEYTRNFSIIMQQAWSYANKENLIKELELKEYRFDPPVIFYSYRMTFYYVYRCIIKYSRIFYEYPRRVYYPYTCTQCSTNIAVINSNFVS